MTIRDQNGNPLTQEQIAEVEKFFEALLQCPRCGGELQIKEYESGGYPFPRLQKRHVICETCKICLTGKRKEFEKTPYASDDERGLRGGGIAWSDWEYESGLENFTKGEVEATAPSDPSPFSHNEKFRQVSLEHGEVAWSDGYVSAVSKPDISPVDAILFFYDVECLLPQGWADDPVIKMINNCIHIDGIAD